MRRELDVVGRTIEATTQSSLGISAYRRLLRATTSVKLPHLAAFSMQVTSLAA
jgi:hypothetical protein